MLEAGPCATIDEPTVADKINASYVSRVPRLTLPTPNIVEPIVDGRQPEGMSLPGLMKGVTVEWQRQNHAAPTPGA